MKYIALALIVAHMLYVEKAFPIGTSRKTDIMVLLTSIVHFFTILALFTTE